MSELAHVEALRKEVERHIQMHEMKIDGLLDAVRLLSLSLTVSGVIAKSDLKANFDHFVEHIKGRSYRSSHHAGGVISVLEHLLALEEEAAKSPGRRFQVIKGDLDD